MPQQISTLQMATRPLLTPLTQLDGIVAALCFGSAALGMADQHSDIDLLIICEPTIPAPARRGQLFTSLPTLTQLELHHTTPGWDNAWAPQTDVLTLGHLRYEVSYNTQSWVTQTVERVITDGALSLPEMPFRPYTLLGLLATAVLLYDPSQVVQRLRQQLHPYPSVLKRHIVQEYTPVMLDGVQELRDYATRNIGNTAFLFQLFRVCDAMCSVLFAINETYDPATKRVERVLEQLKHLPPHFLQRYQQVLEGPFTQRQRGQIAEQVATLVADVQNLV